MSKKIKNPLAVILGLVLKNLRAGTGANEIAFALSMVESAYRMIESGNANLNPNKGLLLLRISNFRQIRYDKLCKFLVSNQILDAKKDNAKELWIELENIFQEDSELKKIFSKSGFDSETLLSDNLTKIFYSNPDVLSEALNYLKDPFFVDIEKVEDNLLSAENEAPCIMQPLMKPSLKKLHQQIQELKEINNIQVDVDKIFTEIDYIKKSKMGYLIHSAAEWRNNKNFVETLGIFRKYENLSNIDVIKSFKDNISQIINNLNFKTLTYIIISDEIDEVKKHCVKFKNVVSEILIEETVEGSKANNILNKISFRIISPRNRLIKSLSELTGDDYSELWLYKDEDYNYSFKTESIMPKFFVRNDEIVFNNKENPDKILEYVVRTVEESNMDWENSKKLINESKQLL